MKGVVVGGGDGGVMMEIRIMEMDREREEERKQRRDDTKWVGGVNDGD